MNRVYNSLIIDHFKMTDKMCFLSGPRQVGKTTVALSAKKLQGSFHYLNWDDPDDRERLLSGTQVIADYCKLNRLSKQRTTIVFDEIHKYKHWKNFLKGFYDKYFESTRIIVTGSSQLDIFKRGGDSMSGRYFHYHIHPYGLAETTRWNVPEMPVRSPKKPTKKTFSRLLDYGGFPEPYIKKNKRFYNRWQRNRHDLLLREEIRDSGRVHEIAQLEILSRLIAGQATQLTSYSSLAKKVRVSVDTIRRWIDTLESFYYCFRLRPYQKNITRSLLKEPKLYLWDWSCVKDSGARFENMIACHLLKATQFWSDIGLGKFELYFIRDKEKREVDFLVTQEEKPWFLVEVKLSADRPLSKHLLRFHNHLKTDHAFQLVKDLPYVNKSVFSVTTPVIVSAQTLLSQLV